jgi:hypothetical protein
MSDDEMSDGESQLYGDPMLSEAIPENDVPDLRNELIESYGDGVLNDDDVLPTDSEFASIYEEERPIDFSKGPHSLSDSESDDDVPKTKNPLRQLLKEAEKVLIPNLTQSSLYKSRVDRNFHFSEKCRGHLPGGGRL